MIKHESLQSVDVLSFDLWLTLLKMPDRAFRSARDAMLHAALAPTTELSEFSAAQQTIKKSADLLAETRGNDVLFEERIDMLCKKLGRRAASASLVSELYDQQGELFAAHPPILIDPDTKSLLESYKAIDKRLAVVSNTGMMHGDQMRGALDQLGISQLFNSMTFSNEIGFAKPDKRIFEDMLQRNDATPGSVIHFGDNLNADIKGAQALGMHTGHLASGQKIGDILAPAYEREIS